MHGNLEKKLAKKSKNKGIEEEIIKNLRQQEEILVGPK